MMKTLTKFFLILIAVQFSIGAYAQAPQNRMLLWPSSLAPTQQSCPVTSPIINPLQGAGFLTGTFTFPVFGPAYNSPYFIGIEYAQLYNLQNFWMADSMKGACYDSTNVNSTFIDSVGIRISQKKMAVNPGNIVVKIYSYGTDFDYGSGNRPQDSLGASAPFSMSNLNVAVGVNTMIKLINPVKINPSGKYFISVLLSQEPGDTICIGAASGDPISGACLEFRHSSYVRFGVSRTNGPEKIWFPIDSLYVNPSTGKPIYAFDLKILPSIYRIGTCNISAPTYDAVKLFNPSPNPADDNIRLNFQVNKSSNIEISVFNTSGQLIKTKNYGRISEGVYEKTFKTSDLSPGFYMYQVRSDTGSSYGKFVVK